MMIKVSFIVIGYNIEHYIEKCINSISKQTLQEIEIVFVDDGSTDQTIHKVKKCRIKICE
ncbi:glycosyltransferase family 2 protein [Clostridium butyricum]